MPKRVGAVLDPPNLTPVARYNLRDAALDEMMQSLAGRIAVVHLKDFRLSGDGYALPGPLKGEMNYPRFVEHIRKLPADVPIIAEHIQPEEFRETREKLLPLFNGVRATG